MRTLHRTEVLLEPEQHRVLAEIAGREGRSISNLVRQIVRQHLVEGDEETRKSAALHAVEELSQIRHTLREQYGLCHGDPVAEVRAEWEENVVQLWRDEACV